MPIPEKLKRAGWDTMTENEFLDQAEVKLMWSWWPRRCAITGELLCFNLAYRAERIWTGPGEPITEYRWYNRYEFLMMRLKGNEND
jgi:hypothetical protein